MTWYSMYISKGACFDAAVITIGTLALSSCEWNVTSHGPRSPANSSKALVVVLAKFVHGWFWCFEFLAEINLTGSVLTCPFPSLVIEFLGRFHWATDPEMTIREMAVISSLLWASLSASRDNFKSFSPVCFSVSISLPFWLFWDFCCSLRLSSFRFRSALCFFKVASLEEILFRSFCKSCPMSRSRCKPNKISFSMLIYLFTLSWAWVGGLEGIDASDGVVSLADWVSVKFTLCVGSKLLSGDSWLSVGRSLIVTLVGTFLSYSRPKISHFGFFRDLYFLPFVCFTTYFLSKFTRWWIIFFHIFPNFYNSIFTSILVLFRIGFSVRNQ